MPHKERKTRKRRGSRTMGWGQVGQHRGSGMRGGFGGAGMHKHKWIYTLKYKSNHFGKRGFKSIAKPYRTINVEDLEVIIRKAGLKANTNGIISLDLSNMGYDKLLGAGSVSVPLMVKVKRISEKAREKVEATGGRIITP